MDDLVRTKRNPAQNSPEEFAAQIFAGALLMPKPGISNAFAVRGWDPARPEPMEVLTIASLFGVGYRTLISHLRYGVGMMGEGVAQSLAKKSLGTLREELVGGISNSPLHLIDDMWNGRPIDLEIGELIYAHGHASIEGERLEIIRVDQKGTLCRAVSSGIDHVSTDTGLSSFVRISRVAFTGRSIFRHLPEVV